MNDNELFKVVEYNPQKADDVAGEKYSYWGSVFFNFRKKKITLVLFFVFIITFLLALICPQIGKYTIDTMRIDLDSTFMTPCSEFWFGTDSLGRDYWVQVWYAARISILMATLVAIGQTFLGVVFGLVWGFVDKLDSLFTFVYNLFDNIPTIIYLTLISFIVGRGFTIMSVSLILIGWISMAMDVRNMVLTLKGREFITASRLLGSSTFAILFKDLLPHLISIIIQTVTLSIPDTIAMESTLSFLGLGLDIDTPSLGVLLGNARTVFLDYPYLLIFPAVIVSIITVAFYLVGNAFADSSDPKNHR